MKIIKENESIVDFKAWAGAKDTLQRILEAGTENQFDTLIEELYPDGITDVQLNDILWFEEDWLIGLGILPDEEIEKKIDVVVEKLTDLIETNTPYLTAFYPVSYRFDIYEEGLNAFEQFYLGDLEFDDDIQEQLLSLISNEEIYELVEAFYE